ncbi:hypothetical protein BCR32DRAFT_326505 [Anaeromyces robustus]|uniref:Uncharacterized protein n=1 Tax=Anaeromyces robustus TaxID=1754192 RepID=A0A1Y1XBR8_9FUNG|nr:hypothetical protein BCR32DRAFT_326505 [Anaeromyces robustus]|eukprot:ORX83188.1 hypothetical protein BCR32DRAFT_326505 [Anaeromyces robustus]
MKKDFIQGINKNFVNDEDISYNSKVTKVYESNIKATREYESSDNEESNTDRTRRFSVANESISYHKNSFMSKIINYHYTVEASGENFNDTESKSIYKTTTY